MTGLDKITSQIQEEAEASAKERLDAAKRTVMLWNTGKVISSSPGE